MTDGTVQPTEKPAAPRKTESLIYIGPNLPPRLAPLRQYQAYTRQELPDVIEALIRRCPSIRELFVPTSKLAASRLAMARDGSRENSFARAVNEFITEQTKPAKPVS